MTAYDVLILDRNGMVRRRRRIDCKDEDDALQRLASLPYPNAMELWQAERLVWRFEARS